MEPIIIPLSPALIFIVVLARVGGLVSFAPFWSNRVVPARARAVLALALALVITPVVAPRMETPPAQLLALGVVIAGELLIGLALGLAGRMVFSALEVAAEVISYQMGFSLASTIDPTTRARTSALGIIAQMLGTVILLASDGHHWFLTATVRSFHTLSPGSFTLTPTLAELFIRMSADALAVGVALAAPLIIVLLMVELALAIGGRAAPQLQVMVLGFPIKIAVGLWLVGASLFFMPGAIRTTLSAIRAGLGRAIAAM